MRTMFLKEGMAHIVDINIVSTMTQEAMVEAMKARMDMDPVYVPHGHLGCAFFVKRGNRTLYAMYVSPKKRRTLNFESQVENADGVRPTKTAKVWLPHTYLLVKFRRRAFEGAYAFMSHKKIRSGEDRVCSSPLPNVYGRGNVCNGDEASFSTRLSPEENAEKYGRFFLESKFSNDILEGYQNLPQEFKGEGQGIDLMFEHWEEASRGMTYSSAQRAYSQVNMNEPIGAVMERMLS